jgi:signal transduction histidine kinase
MKIRSIILYWLLLLVPTVAIAVAAFQVLSREQERIIHEATAAARDRARAIAEHLLISIESVESDLTEALNRIPAGKERETLGTWERNNPLVRNVFIWKPGTGLLYPEPDTSGTADEKRFIVRYDALFSGRVPWRVAETETPGSARTRPGGAVHQPSSPQAKTRVTASDPGQDLHTQKHALSNLATTTRSGLRGHGEPPSDRERAGGKTNGWIPWFAENRLYILGWVRRGATGLMYGVELELMALLSRVVGEFPASVPQGTVYALVDGEGKILHQVGSAPVEPGVEPELTVSLAPQLPHWQVAVFFVSDRTGARSPQGFIILSGLLLGIFVVAIVAGGTLLTRQAHRNMRDAQQKTSFVSNVSHELKTPLTTIRMYAELLSEERVKDPEKKRQYLRVIVAESQRLARLVNNVLDFSRLEQGRKKYHYEESDLAEYTREFVEAHRLRVHEAGLTFDVQIPNRAVMVRTDRDGIEQVLLNLVDNAIKYAADGGEVRLTLEVMDSLCRVRVMDRGSGVSREHREKIFDKFHRVDDSLTSRQQGAGLGLSIGRRIARDLGGDLSYEPRPGGGSCFVLVIPLCPELRS